jgi:hypothetical protein
LPGLTRIRTNKGVSTWDNSHVSPIHGNFILAEFRSKRSNVRRLVSATDCGRTNVEIGRIFSKLAEFRPNRRTKNQPWVEFRPTWTLVRPKSVAEIKLRAFKRFKTNFGQKKFTVLT